MCMNDEIRMHVPLESVIVLWVTYAISHASRSNGWVLEKSREILES